MLVDLHCHSTWSDGAESAATVAERASLAGVVLFSLTDHDCASGCGATRAAFPAPRVSLPGVELSCQDDGKVVHLLAYRCGTTTHWPHLHQHLDRLANRRRHRVHAIAARLAELGVELDAERVVGSCRGTVGRLHIARELAATGAVTSVTEAFQRYLKDGGPADVAIERLSVGEALELCRAAQARVSLAHPHTLGARAVPLFRRHRGGGLTGIEAYYAPYSERERRVWLDLAADQDLVVTAGSDYHGGDGSPSPRLGVELPESYARRLVDWLEVDLSAPPGQSASREHSSR